MRVRDGKKVAHEGIKVEFVGSIGMPICRRPFGYTSIVPAELFYDRGHHHEFLSLSQELAAPGEMRQAQTFDFLFKNIEKQYESYQGINVKLRSARLCIPLGGVSDAQTQVFHPRLDIQADGGREQRERPLGALVQDASR